VLAPTMRTLVRIVLVISVLLILSLALWSLTYPSSGDRRTSRMSSGKQAFIRWTPMSRSQRWLVIRAEMGLYWEEARHSFETNLAR